MRLCHWTGLASDSLAGVVGVLGHGIKRCRTESISEEDRHSHGDPLAELEDPATGTSESGDSSCSGLRTT